MAGALLAALANGPLKEPEPGRTWRASDFMPALWQHNATEPEADKPATVQDIMASARAADGAVMATDVKLVISAQDKTAAAFAKAQKH